MEEVFTTNLETYSNDHILPNIVDDLTKPVDSRVGSVLRQPIRNLDTTIQVLNDDGSVFQTVQGKAISGGVSIDASSLIRRTGNLSLVVDPEYMPKNGGISWWNRQFRMYQSIVDMSVYPHEPINFLLGTFYIDEETLNVDLENSSIDINLSDKMTLYENYALEHRLKISKGTPISVAMRKIMEFVGETSFGYMHESSEKEVLTYDYIQELGTNVLDIVRDLRDMYMDYTCGYNNKGEFEFYKVEIQQDEETKTPKWTFDPNAEDRADLTLGFSETYSLKDVYNRIVVFGATSSKTRYTPQAEAAITDAKNPYNIDAIGRRTKVIQNNNLTDEVQCYAEAKYNLWKLAHFQEMATISTIPVYVIDGKDIIEIVNPVTNEKNKYVVDSVIFDLGINGTMTINAYKLYYVKMSYGDSEAPIAKAIRNGIDNLGWLSLGEQRIKDVYGISGSGKNTIMIRLVSQQQGGEQASITGYLTTKVQTLEIDVKDFQKLNLKSQDGDAGRSKGDYVDRVLAHEMFHAVCNDYFSVDKMQEAPTWFKEGFAELLHGGRERYRSVTGFTEDWRKKEFFVNRAKDMLDGAWASLSEDYVTAYLISASIYYLVGKDGIIKMFQRLRDQENIGLNFLVKALPQLGSTLSEAKNAIINKMNTMDLWSYLDNDKDTDTGSIGGSHMENLYGRALSAEDVFNNSEATTDSIGFKLQYEY